VRVGRIFRRLQGKGGKKYRGETTPAWSFLYTTQILTIGIVRPHTLLEAALARRHGAAPGTLKSGNQGALAGLPLTELNRHATVGEAAPTSKARRGLGSLHNLWCLGLAVREVVLANAWDAHATGPRLVLNADHGTLVERGAQNIFHRARIARLERAQGTDGTTT
jgi:hypothetical protein